MEMRILAPNFLQHIATSHVRMLGAQRRLFGNGVAGKRGFSLIEVTIALAIAAGGFITLLGLLPHGLEMSRRTSEMAATARILEHVSGELMQMPWEELNWTGHGTSSTARRLYDDQGIPLESIGSLSGSNASMLSYVASIYLIPETDEKLGLRLPEATGSSNTEKYVRKALIFIASTVDPDYVFPDVGQPTPGYVKVHPVTIPLVKAKPN